MDEEVTTHAEPVIAFFDEHGVDSFEELGIEDQVDLYVMLAGLSSAADDMRKEVGNAIESRMKKEQTLTGNVGSVKHVTRTRRNLRDERTVVDVLSDAGVARGMYMAPEKSKVERAIGEAGIRPELVFDQQVIEYVSLASTDWDAIERLYPTGPR